MRVRSIATFAILNRSLPLSTLILLTVIPQVVAQRTDEPSVSTSTYYSCGVTTAGAAYCWGRNHIGQLGNGTETNSNVPVAVKGGLTFQSLSAGFYHSCGVTTAGTAYCWGNNKYGLFGNGTNTNSNVPVLVDLTFSP